MAADKILIELSKCDAKTFGRSDAAHREKE
jgi:hypothetical protein